MGELNIFEKLKRAIGRIAWEVYLWSGYLGEYVDDDGERII